MPLVAVLQHPWSAFQKKMVKYVVYLIMYWLANKWGIVGIVRDACMSVQVSVGNGQELRIRGSDGLDHPALDRGGSSGTKRHFVLTGTAKMTMINLQLKGAWVGLMCCNFLFQ